MKEKTIYEIIKRLVDTNGNKKGRIERFNQTFQNRLPQEMRTAHIKTLEQANKFLTSYLPKFNARFALQRKNISSVFESQPTEEKINLTLAILTSRKFDHGSSIKFQNKYYQATNSTGTDIIRFRNGTELKEGTLLVNLYQI